MAEQCKGGRFVDDQLRFSVAVPSNMLDKFQFISRKGISPNFKHDKEIKAWSKAERIKFGLDKEHMLTTRKPMMKDYLKLPMQHAEHPAQIAKTNRTSSML